MSNPFASLFGSDRKVGDVSNLVHFELSNIFRITLNVEDTEEVVILPNLIGEETELNSTNINNAVQQRMTLENAGQS